MKIIIASKNKGKIEEIKHYLLDTTRSSIDIASLCDYPDIPEIIEDGQTFEENALKKAVSVAEYTGEIALADDSGLVVDCLNGEPGVLSARFGGEGLDDNSRSQLLLERMKDSRNRTARFICVIALAAPGGGRVKTVTGSCEGTIAFSRRGEQGFGYDPVFIPDGYTATFAELGIGVKNKFSHRARALEKARDAMSDMSDSSDMSDMSE